MIESRLFFDTGMFILIWLVQLIIYPSFLFYSKENFLKWHKSYTKALMLIVGPLLAGQGLTVAYQFFTTYSFYSFISSILITSAVVYTFIHFIPLHAELERNHSFKTIKKLINNNWYRTFIWTLVVIIDVFYIVLAKY